MKKSFTLIEMLIVVVIIGILAAALIPRLQSVQARARDTKRKADLHQIGTALAIYKEDNGSYGSLYDPTAQGGWCGHGVGGWPLTNASNLTNNYSNDSSIQATMSMLERYMTSVPMESNISTNRSANTCPQIYGYFLGVLPRRGGTMVDSIVLVAMTESDGSSSNWVTTNSMVGSNIVTGYNGMGRIGATLGMGITSSAPRELQPFSAQIYDDYMCSTVTLSGGTENNGQGTCYADRNGSDLRYIYVQ